MHRITFSILSVTALVASTSHAQKASSADVIKAEREYYNVSAVPMPPGEVLEVSGLEWLPGGKLAVSTRRGEIWVATNPASEAPEWKRFAHGLHEPLGISFHDGWLWATQRPEVTRMKDTDGDGKADVFENVAAPWGINGDYHEYAFGARSPKDGSIWNVLCLTGSGSSNSLFRGFVIRVLPDGKSEVVASGVRSPGGIGFGPDGEAFYTDNQGLWNGSSSLKHLKVGSFQGNPTGFNSFDAAAKRGISTGLVTRKPATPKSGSRIDTERSTVEEFVPPAVVLPHGILGHSPTGMCYDLSGKFGPFKGQLFVGEQTFSNVQRVFLEKVNGVYQGAAFHFISGFGSGNIAVLMTPDGVLYTGGSDRGWGAKGGKPFALERAVWNGKAAFEIHEMRAKPDGFELTFTQPVDPKTAADPASYSADAWTYIYQSSYGSPEVDKLKPAIVSATVGADGKSVRLKLDKLTKGHVHAIGAEGVKSADGKGLLHAKGYYTLNEIPN
jgi:glucose/arabinose dehydrogenase